MLSSWVSIRRGDLVASFVQAVVAVAISVTAGWAQTEVVGVTVVGRVTVVGGDERR